MENKCQINKVPEHIENWVDPDVAMIDFTAICQLYTSEGK